MQNFELKYGQINGITYIGVFFQFKHNNVYKRELIRISAFLTLINIRKMKKLSAYLEAMSD